MAKRRQRAKKVEEIPQPPVCETCGGKGYVELDKIGLRVQACWNCAKGIEKAREMGIPEYIIARNMNVGNSGNRQAVNNSRSPDTGEPEKPEESEAKEPAGEVSS